MAIFRRIGSTARQDLERVQSEITRLSAALARHDERATAVEATVAAQPLPPLPAWDPPERRVAGIDPSAELWARVDAVAAQLDTLDARLTAVSTELANQLGELSRDIDALNNRPAGPIDTESLDELRDTQLRLANEQARYQIAFRADLARLAEHLQRRRP